MGRSIGFSIAVLGFGVLYVVRAVESDGIKSLPSALALLIVMFVAFSGAALLMLFSVQRSSKRRLRLLTADFPNALGINVVAISATKAWLDGRGAAPEFLQQLTLMATTDELSIWGERARLPRKLLVLESAQVTKIDAVLQYVGFTKARVLRIHLQDVVLEFILANEGVFGFDAPSQNELQSVADQLNSYIFR